jgi:hypothetical protein
VPGGVGTKVAGSNAAWDNNVCVSVTGTEAVRHSVRKRKTNSPKETITHDPLTTISSQVYKRSLAKLFSELKPVQNWRGVRIGYRHPCDVQLRAQLVTVTLSSPAIF